MNYFSSLDANLQYNLGEEIITEIERYRTLVEADLKHGETIELAPVLNQFMESIEPLDIFTAIMNFTLVSSM